MLELTTSHYLVVHSKVQLFTSTTTNANECFTNYSKMDQPIGKARVPGMGWEGGGSQWWANLDQASKDLDKTIFLDLSPTPIP
jgi:hypothetical protein